MPTLQIYIIKGGCNNCETEMVSLVLSDLKKTEVIEIGHKKITVLEREKLLRVAEA